MFQNRIAAIERHGGACRVVKLPGSHHPHLEPESSKEVTEAIRSFVFA